MKMYNVFFKVEGVVNEGVATGIKANNDVEAEGIFLDEYCQEHGYILEDVEVLQIVRVSSRRSEDDD